ncbi:putative membrane protein [Moraxella catarrhalis]|uniref:Putative membrane protein n=1 Tax=Moraxella catarrhalis TaxID=480 RepID=A0A3S9QGZ6_MORCA|nr:putative membrane protein [Moraxella catarrhalis]
MPWVISALVCLNLARWAFYHYLFTLYHQLLFMIFFRLTE